MRISRQLDRRGPTSRTRKVGRGEAVASCPALYERLRLVAGRALQRPSLLDPTLSKAQDRQRQGNRRQTERARFRNLALAHRERGRSRRMKGIRRVGAGRLKTQIRKEVDKAAHIVAESDVVGSSADGRGPNRKLSNTGSRSRCRAGIEIAARELSYS